VKKLSGYIPSRLKYVQRPAKEVEPYQEHELGETPEPGVLLRETFVVDATNPRTLKTAMEWAERGIARQKKDSVTVTERDNSPIPVLELITLDIRSEGGRAWKVLVDGQYYVDLREDVLLDTLKRGKGVQKGELHGPFVWCVVGSHMKLVRVDSPLHKAIQEAGKRKETKDIPSKNLEVGGIYENRRGKQFLFLGECDTESYQWVKSRGCSDSSSCDQKFEVIEFRKIQMWVKIPDYGDASPNEFFLEKPRSPWRDSIWPSSKWLTYLFELTKEKAVTNKIGSFEIPSNLFDFLHQMGRDEVGLAKECTIRRKLGPSETRVEIRANWAAQSHLLRLRSPGAPAPNVPELDELDQFCEKEPKKSKETM
jgi:hypothetical protein